MYEAAQLVVKLIIVTATVLVAVIVCIRVWRADLDLRALLSPQRMIERSVDSTLSLLPQREIDAIYQNNVLVARVVGPTRDDANQRLLFQEIFESNGLDLSREFEFQKWRLKFLGAETMAMLDASRPQKGRVIEAAVCQILGRRAAF